MMIPYRIVILFFKLPDLLLQLFLSTGQDGDVFLSTRAVSGYQLLWKIFDQLAASSCKYWIKEGRYFVKSKTQLQNKRRFTLAYLRIKILNTTRIQMSQKVRKKK